MELNDETMKLEFDRKPSVSLKRELETYISKWKELEDKGEKFLLEIKKGISEIESLKKKFDSLEKEKISIENEVKELEKKITYFGNTKDVIDLKCDEEDEITRLMIENKVLECEKRTAESMIEDLKPKCRRLEIKKLTHKNLTVGSDVNTSGGSLQHEMAHHMGFGVSQEATGTPLDTMASDRYIQDEKALFPFEGATRYGKRVKKQLTFVEELSTCKKIAPSTPGIKRPSYCVVDITDSEDDQEHKTNVHRSPFCALRNEIANEDDISNFYFPSSHKRKRLSNVITSDSESNDDNISIGKLRNKHLLREFKDDLDDFDLNDGVKESPPSRRRLMRKCDKKVIERSSSTGSETLGGFIVSGSDISEEKVGSSVSQVVSDNDVDLDEVISKIRRKKENMLKWEFEADMLADFGKNIELCMKAVCVLYRQQTTEEKCSKWTIFLNGRGFSQCDAPRGSNLADFLCNGDPKIDVCKSVEELREYNPEGPELCRTLATHYSKQLFEIYKNKEDPHFLPS